MLLAAFVNNWLDKLLYKLSEEDILYKSASSKSFVGDRSVFELEPVAEPAVEADGVICRFKFAGINGSSGENCKFLEKVAVAVLAIAGDVITVDCGV